jgi:aspartate aminotransferase-like enzyme
MHEAAVLNLVNKKMLSCANGTFGKRWYDVAKSNGKDVDLFEMDWREPLSAEKIASALEGKDYEVITFIHNETSTGLMNPIKEIAEMVHSVSPETLICVDAVSSLSGAKLEMDEWGLDLVLTSSQKCFALPPGLAFVAVNERAFEKAKNVEHRGWYFDFLRLEKHRIANSTPATPAVSLIYALDLQTDRILAEGLEARWARHSAMAVKAQAWALSNNFGLYAPEGFRSQTMTAIEHQGFDFEAANAFLIERGMRMASGYGPLKDSVFRIGHMGELSVDDLDRLFVALDAFQGR